MVAKRTVTNFELAGCVAFEDDLFPYSFEHNLNLLISLIQITERIESQKESLYG